MNYKILNLINRLASDIPYHINSYPDGHKHIVLEGCEWNKNQSVDVITRIASMDDLFILLQAYSILQHENIFLSNVYITYLLTARCDRRFSMGEAVDLDILGEILERMNTNIFVYDAHSIPNCHTYIENKQLITKFIPSEVRCQYNICFPDEGAAERYCNCVHTTNLIGKKHRKPDGISIDVREIHPIDPMLPILVIDDLCDGGGTFVAFATELEERYPQHSKEIWVSHAIQKKGIELLATKYDKVYITNSYKDWNKEELPSNVIVFDVCHDRI